MASSLKWNITGDFNEDQTTLNSVLEYLKEYKDSPHTLIRTHEGYNAISFLNIFNSRHIIELNNQSIDKIMLSKDHGLYLQLWQIFELLITSRESWIKGDVLPQVAFDHIQETTDDRERKLLIAGSLLVNFNFLLTISESLPVILNRSSCIKLFLSVLADERLNRLKVNELFTILILNLASLSKFAYMNKAEWAELKVIDSLLEIVETNPNYQHEAYGIIANIATDDQIESLEVISDVVAEFVKALREKQFTEKHSQRFQDEDSKKSIVTEIDSYYDEEKKYYVPITFILFGLDLLAINDKIKLILYQQLGMAQLRKLIVDNQNEVVQQHAAQILTRLCCNQQVLDDLIKDQKLCDFIIQLGNNRKINWKKLTSTCENIKWQINQRKIEAKKDQVVPAVQQPKAQGYKFDVMISYNWSSQDLVKKIKSSLESHGLKVWIDIEQMKGDVLDAMTEGIHSSRFFLMCVSEKYRLSQNCRCEAQYAHKFNNDFIIPIIMQKGYGDVTGWLGFIMVQRLYVDFTNRDHETAIQELLQQMKLLVGKDVSQHNSKKPAIKAASIEDKATNVQDQKVPTNAKQQASDWNTAQVEAWFAEQSLDNTILKNFSPQSGEDLVQLYRMQTHTPEMFYQMARQIEGMDDPRSFLKFSVALKKLFEGSN